MNKTLFLASMMSCTFALAWGGVLEACSSSSSTPATPADAGNDSSAADAPVDHAPVKSATPTFHRTAATTCGKTRAASQPGDAGSDAGMDPCKVDGDCVAGKNGRCILLVNATLCTYDECYADSDCTSGQVCMCRDAQDIIPDIALNGIPRPTNTVCATAECTIDNDCGSGGFCSPSIDPTTKKYSFQCHVAADECTNDEDCGCPNGTQTDLCRFDPSKGHWACYLNDCH